jgi:Zn-dependent protease
MFFQDAPGFISVIITLVIAFTVHEFAHAWTANQLGDDTPRLHGRLTLNPLVHLDLVGTLMLIVAGFGWAKPVPVTPENLQQRTPAGMMLVAAAGPFSNLVMAMLASIPFQFGLIDRIGPSGNLLPSYTNLFLTFIIINLLLFFFNLIPIFPLDGEKVLHYFLPYNGKMTLLRLRPYGTMILLGLILLSRVGGINLFGILIGTPAEFVFNLLV